MGLFDSASKVVSTPSIPGLSSGKIESIAKIASGIPGLKEAGFNELVGPQLQMLKQAGKAVDISLPDVDTTKLDASLAAAIANLPKPSEPTTFEVSDLVLPTITPTLATSVADVGFTAPTRFAEDQAGLIQALQAQAAGQGISPAAMMLQQAQDENARQAMALAASMSGRALPAAQRQILQQQALGGQEAAREMAILKAQEQLAAQQQLAGAIQGARGQEIDIAGLEMQAAQGNQAAAMQLALANQAAQQAAQQQKAAQQLEAEMFTAGQKLAAQELEDRATREREALEAQLATAALGAQVGVEETKLKEKSAREIAEAQAKAALAGAGLSTAGALGAAAVGG